MDAQVPDLTRLSASAAASRIASGEITSVMLVEAYLERISAIQPQEILEAAHRHLKPSNRVVGTFIPTGKGVNG